MTSSELMEGKVEKKLNSSHSVLGDEGYHAPRPKDDGIEFRNKVVSFLEKEGISAKYHHHEGGLGQSEMEVGLKNLLAGADNTLSIKHITKVFAQLSGKSATFMQKPIGDALGSGMHLHQYLLKEEKNLFAGEEYEGLRVGCNMKPKHFSRNFIPGK